MNRINEYLSGYLKLMKKIILSAVMIAGTCRKRAQKSLDALCQQTIIDQMEIIVVDLGAETCPPFTVDSNIRVSTIQMPKFTSWAVARTAAIFKTAESQIVAFIEDHSFAAPDWAEQIVNAFTGPWAAVGYSVMNANPETYMSCAGLMADYSLCMPPIQDGRTDFLPGNNVAYRRDLLIQFGDRLKTDLGIDFNIHEALKKQGHEFVLSSKAVIAHQNYDRIGGLLKANYNYSRMIAANRIASSHWGIFTQTVYIVGTPFASPIIRLIRIIKSLRGRSSLVWPFISALPVLLITFSCSALAEASGYLSGAGQSVKDFNIWELMTERTNDQ